MSMRQPVLFLSHGSPMNAVEANDFTAALGAFGRRLEEPKAILCVSAHWTGSGLRLGPTAETGLIYDFYGFPPALYRLRWPAPPAVDLAERLGSLLASFSPRVERARGLDHGAWSVLKLLFPEARVPVLQLSLDGNRSSEEHSALARALGPLRDEGILVVGSGNFTHNLSEIAWDGGSPPPDWAQAFDNDAMAALDRGDLGFLEAAVKTSRAGSLRAHPSDEHLLPLLYAAALADADERPELIFEGWQNGSLSMRSLSWGRG